MSLENIAYSTLVVSGAEAFNSTIKEMLPVYGCQPIKIAASISEAKFALAEKNYDFIIINSPLQDETGTRFAIDCCQTPEAVVLLLVRNELHAEIYDKVMRHGVFTLPKPTSRIILSQALNWMASTKERMRKLQKKSLSVEERMEEIRLVNRAKWFLISELHMSEPEAHRTIEKQAMDHCVSKKKIAEEIIKTYS